MKRAIYIFILFVFLLVAYPEEVLAGYNGEIIDETEIQKFVFDPTREVLEYKIVPIPTPTPPYEEVAGTGKDNRSWTRSEYKKIIDNVSRKYDIDQQIIYATIMNESGGNPYAFRYEPQIKDASFCMGQILLSTARSLGFVGNPKELYKPEVCIDLIGKYHRKIIDTYGKLTPAQLAVAYNAGSPWKRPVYGHIARFQKWMNEEAV